MLVLSRYRDQVVEITSPEGVTISVMVCQADRNGRVSLGFEAPRDWLILRKELVGRDTKLKKEVKDGKPAKPAA